VSYASNGWITSTSIPTISTPLIDALSNTPITGQANQWIAISSILAPGVVVYAVQVDAFGTIIDVILC